MRCKNCGNAGHMVDIDVESIGCLVCGHVQQAHIMQQPRILPIIGPSGPINDPSHPDIIPPRAKTSWHVLAEKVLKPLGLDSAPPHVRQEAEHLVDHVARLLQELTVDKADFAKLQEQIATLKEDSKLLYAQFDALHERATLAEAKCKELEDKGNA